MIRNCCPVAVPLLVDGAKVVLPAMPVRETPVARSRCTITEPCDGVPCVEWVDVVEDLPAPEPGVWLLVSGFIARMAAVLGRTDVVAVEQGSYADGCYRALIRFKGQTVQE